MKTYSYCFKKFPSVRFLLGPFKCYVTQMGVGGVNFYGKKHYEGVRFNVISVTRGWVGVHFPGKKRYVTLEWPLMEKTHLKSCCLYKQCKHHTRDAFSVHINGFILESCHIGRCMESLIICLYRLIEMSTTQNSSKKRSVCGTSQFAGSSGPVPYTLRVINGVKWVFRQSLSLPQKIFMIAFMHCKAVVRINVG